MRIRLTLLLLAWPLAGLIAADPPIHLRPVSPEQLQQAIRETRTRVVVVNVWATWCVPCRKEFPHFVKFRNSYRDGGVEVLFLSTDFEDSLEQAREFLDRQKVTWPNYLKTGKDEPFIDSLSPKWSGAQPATFVYDKDRKMVDFWEGEVTYEELEKRLAPRLE